MPYPDNMDWDAFEALWGEDEEPAPEREDLQDIDPVMPGYDPDISFKSFAPSHAGVTG